MLSGKIAAAIYTRIYSFVIAKTFELNNLYYCVFSPRIIVLWLFLFIAIAKTRGLLNLFREYFFQNDGIILLATPSLVLIS